MTKEERRDFERKVTALNRHMQCGRCLCGMAVHYAPDDEKMQVAYLRASTNVIRASDDIKTFDDMVRYFYNAT